MGLQEGFTKNCCFLCLWNSCATARHYETKQFQTRNLYATGMKDNQHNHLINPDKVLILQLHIKLELTKSFRNAIAKHRLNGFKFLCKKFPKQSQAKL